MSDLPSHSGLFKCTCTLPYTEILHNLACAATVLYVVFHTTMNSGQPLLDRAEVKYVQALL